MKTKKNSAEVANVNHSTLAQLLIRDRLFLSCVYAAQKHEQNPPVLGKRFVSTKYSECSGKMLTSWTKDYHMTHLFYTVEKPTL